MAIIECDMHNREHPADVMFTRMANGETVAACEDGFVEFCVGIARMAADAEAQATDDEAVARLDAVAPPPEFPTSPEWSGEDVPAAELPTQPDSGPDVPEVAPVTTPDEPEPPQPARAPRARVAKAE